MPIKFITLPKEQTEQNITQLQGGKNTIEIVLTDGISEITRDIHEKAAAVIERNPKLGQRAKTVIESLVGHVHGRAIEEVRKALEKALEIKYGDIDTQKAIRNTTTWNLGPNGIRATFRNGIVILAPFKGPVEIPKPVDPEPEIPTSIESIDVLKSVFEQLIKFYVKPNCTPADAAKMRAKLKGISSRNQGIRALIKKLEIQAMLLTSKEPLLRPTQESLLKNFVTEIYKLSKATLQEASTARKLKKPHRKPTRKEMEELEALLSGDPQDEDDRAGFLDERDLATLSEDNPPQEEIEEGDEGGADEETFIE